MGAEAQQAVSQMNGSILDEKQLAVDPWTGPNPRKQQQGGAYFGNASNPWDAMMAMMMGGGGGGGYPKKNETQKKVKVNNVPEGMSWQELKNHMQTAGTVDFCGVKMGVGEVRYKTEAEAQNAIATLNGSIFGTSSLQVAAWA